MKCSYSALMTDFYELTMMQGFLERDPDRQAVFDMFFRRHPFGGGYAVFAGLDPLLDALENFSFIDSDIEYIRSLNYFSDRFIDYLRDFRFRGEIHSVSEGTVVFPNEPLMRVKGTLLETQIIEPLLLNFINFQTLIATKSARVCGVAGDASVMEFGLRRAQGTDGAISAARASFIGGVKATSNVLAGKEYGIPVKGTMAHSWVMSFDSERAAFEAFADMYPDDCILLADTYDTLMSGVPNALKVFAKLKAAGRRNYGIRLDSGDLSFLSREARRVFDKEGFTEAKIIASNDLDEWIIEQLSREGASIDAYGVGTRLVTADRDPSLTGVYKLAAKEENGSFSSVMKITNNPEKMSNPGIKNVYRFYGEDGMMLADLVLLEDSMEEVEGLIAEKKPIRLNHPSIEYSYKTLENYAGAKLLLRKVMENGKRTEPKTELKSIQAHAMQELSALHGTYKRFLNPHIYKVSLSNNLKKLKMSVIKDHMS
ncbi:nicotinate phosphoribosyltransferase [Geovibrio thiophilus]|uniref:Nicotinate phosphoribosyltransferase n=1 Tax=Geovibrio thiophilus TaxID=139438 RepID=A0A410K0E8_9BACT|nr:nicotinate phosphoribosyltransferase [Geovibrio thiophilus]QAR33872.1 nicotinate phosphoribosyltransferase [Geovibrio thiophilus]